jgi:hypothetical protein
VPRWVDLYRERLGVEPETRAPIDPTGDAWRQALGDMSRVVDWTAMFARALNEGGEPTGRAVEPACRRSRLGRTLTRPHAVRGDSSVPRFKIQAHPGHRKSAA